MLGKIAHWKTGDGINNVKEGKNQDKSGGCDSICHEDWHIHNI